MSLLCLDGVVPPAIPTSQLALGYVDGDYRTYGELVEEKRHAFVFPVTVVGVETAIIADVESGDLTPTKAAIWALGRLNRSKRPCVYGTQETLDAVKTALERLRVHQDLCDYFLARWAIVGGDYDFKMTGHHAIPDGLCGWQYWGNASVPGGHIVDVSVVTDEFATRHGWER